MGPRAPPERCRSPAAGARGKIGASLYPKSARLAPRAQQVWRGAAQQRHPASRPAYCASLPARSSASESVRPRGVSTRLPSWLPARVAGSSRGLEACPRTGPRTPRPQSWGWLSTEGCGMEPCPAPVLFLKRCGIASCQSPVCQPFNLQRLSFHQ